MQDAACLYGATTTSGDSLSICAQLCDCDSQCSAAGMVCQGWAAAGVTQPSQFTRGLPPRRSVRVGGRLRGRHGHGHLDLPGRHGRRHRRYGRQQHRWYGRSSTGGTGGSSTGGTGGSGTGGTGGAVDAGTG